MRKYFLNVNKDGKVTNLGGITYKKDANATEKKVYISAYMEKAPANKLVYITDLAIGAGQKVIQKYTGKDGKLKERTFNLPLLFVNEVAEKADKASIKLWVNKYNNSYTTSSKKPNTNGEYGVLNVRFGNDTEEPTLNKNNGALIEIQDYYFGAQSIANAENTKGETVDLVPVLYITKYSPVKAEAEEATEAVDAPVEEATGETGEAAEEEFPW